jgi:excisionase family DNA binding protein
MRTMMTSGATVDRRADDPALLTVPEACRYLRVSRWMLYRLIQTNDLRTIKIGRRRLVPAAAVQEFVNGRARSEELS